MTKATELRNDALELLGKAKAAHEASDGEAYKTLWAEYQGKAAEAEEAEKAETELKAALEKYDAPASQQRDPKDAVPVGQRPEDAKDGVMIQRDGGGFEVIPFASEKSEGWVKGNPPDVQLPSVRRRLTPELREKAEFREAAFFKYCRYGKAQLDAKELKALQEGTDSEGGFLVPTDAVRLPIIVNKGVRGGRVRQQASSYTTSRDSGDWPVTTDDVDWAGVAEEAAFAADDPVFSQVPFTIRKAGRLNLVSQEVLEDSAVDLPSLLGQLFQNGLGRYEDRQSIEGDGTTEPLGLRTTGAPQGNIADVTDLITLAAPTVVEVLNAFYELGEQWKENASWFFTSSFMAQLAAIGATAAGIHVFQELLRTEPNPTLLGKPIFLFDGTGWDNAATIGANEELGAFGDFRTYYFVNRVGMSITRLDELYAATDQVGFKARVRYDSFFTTNGSFLILKAAAS